jgi:hypothetical protein
MFARAVWQTVRQGNKQIFGCSNADKHTRKLERQWSAKQAEIPDRKSSFVADTVIHRNAKGMQFRRPIGGR